MFLLILAERGVHCPVGKSLGFAIPCDVFSALQNVNLCDEDLPLLFKSYIRPFSSGLWKSSKKLTLVL